jgi:hypothetical protein
VLNPLSRVLFDLLEQDHRGRLSVEDILAPSGEQGRYELKWRMDP